MGTGRSEDAPNPSGGSRPTRGAAPGSVTLVGAGPGDPDLLTLKAARAIQGAEVIFHDALVSPDILGLAHPAARLVPVGKRAGRPSPSQATIEDMMVAAARAGHEVVRLKGGDPFVFGRGGEEAAHLRAHGVPVHVVPGVTAALGCAAEAGIPLTHRDRAHAVRIVTATRQRGSHGQGPDWDELADAETTLVVYMARAEAGRAADGLIRGGLDPATPVAVIANGTRPDRAHIFAPLTGLSDAVGAIAADAPAIVIIGAVVGLSPFCGAHRTRGDNRDRTQIHGPEEIRSTAGPEDLWQGLVDG